MKNREDIQFKKWKKSRSLNEGFLDGEEEKPVTADDTAGQEETKEEGKEETDASVEEPSDDVDISEEPSEDTDDEEETFDGDDFAEEDDDEPVENTEDFQEGDEKKEEDGTKDEGEGTSGIITPDIPISLERLANFSIPYTKITFA